MKAAIKHIQFKYIFLIFAAVLLNIRNSQAQLSGFQSAYFINPYLVNPAMAGLDKGLKLNLGYQQQWSTVPGSPKLQNLTVDYNSGNNVGVGLNVNSDQAGLINTSRVMGTYAYHLTINKNGDKLNLGLSFGVNDTYVDYSKVVGDQGDASVQNYNQSNVYLDGDFGISYTTNKFTLQGALPNIKSVFGGTDANNNLEVDRATFYTAASYKIILNNIKGDFSLQPMLALRGVKGFDNILDVGLNFASINYHCNLTGFYHSNKSATLAAGFDVGQMGLMLAYTDNTGPLSIYANNTFEFGVRFKFSNK